MFNEYAKSYTSTLLDFNPSAPIENRALWESLSLDVKNEIILAGEQLLHFTYPTLPASLYMNFIRTGNRTDFEVRYFKRRNALNALVLAECVENKGRFLEDIINGIFALCEESAWQLPAHNSYIRNAPSSCLPDSTRPIIELKTRILNPYLSQHFWWMGNGDEPMCNWTIWCTQNILLTTFLTHQDHYTKFLVFQKACESIDYFLEAYGENGCCDEGAQYYRHAGLCLFNALEVLCAITNGYFSSLYENNKLKNMADYISQVHVAGPYYINFADCSPKAGLCGVREFLFGKRTHNEALMQLAASHYQEAHTALLTDEINLLP